MLTTTNTLLEALKDLFRNMNDGDIISVWNEYCYSVNRYDDEVMDCETLMECIENSNGDTLTWLNRFYFGSDDYSQEGSANPNRNYFTFNGYGNIESFDYIYNQYSDKFNHIDIDELVKYIADNDEDFCNDDIRALLNEADED